MVRLPSGYDLQELSMLIAKVIGTTISTIKEPTLEGRKLLILRQTDVDGVPVGKPYVAVDTLDAGIGDLVLTAHGSSGRQTDITKNRPVDAVIMAVIDHLSVLGEVTYKNN
jgi:microcompartment protein CcmK/EutM